MAEWTMKNGEPPRLTDMPEIPLMGCFAAKPQLTSVRYRGSAQQWETIEKSETWNAASTFTIQFSSI